jgi:ribosome-interacting GTPase 1
MPANLTVQYLAAETKYRAARTIEDRRAALEELYAGRFPTLRVSATAGTGFHALKLELWQLLEVARAYTKPPGKPVERGSPFLLPLGSTVLELAT